MKKLCLIWTLLAVSACQNDLTGPASNSRALTADEQAVATASNKFAFDLIKAADAGDRAAANLMISPLSVSMALGMTLNGAAGSTFTAMRNTLGFVDLTQSQVNTAYRGLIEQLHARDRAVTFELANSVWYDTKFVALPTFTDTVKRFFDAEVQQLDFKSATAPQTISKWAEDKTNGRIKDLIKSIDPTEVMFLVNAVYFKAPWTKTFDSKQTQQRSFTRADGSRVDVAMMHARGSYRTVENTNVTAAELFYGDSAFSIVLWMPAAGKPASAALDVLEPTKWNALLAAMSGGYELNLPKFKFTYEKVLNDVLTQLGMGIAFTTAADFSRINGTGNLAISRVNHKAFVEVNEEGTEAAAATSVGVTVTSLPPTITFDRPFYFAIRERTSGAILFAGRVGDPNAT